MFQWVPIIRGFSLFVSRPGPYSPQISLNMFFKKSKWFQSDWVECEQHFSLAKRCSTRFFFFFFCLFDCQQYVTCQTQSLGRDPACRIIFLWHTKATKVCLLHVAKLISSFQRRRKSAPKIIFGGFTRAPYYKPRPRTVCAFTLLAVSPSPLLRLILHAFWMSLWCFTVLFFLVIEREDLACSRDYFFLLRARRNKSRSSVSESL